LGHAYLFSSFVLPSSDQLSDCPYKSICWDVNVSVTKRDMLETTPLKCSSLVCLRTNPTRK